MTKRFNFLRNKDYVHKISFKYRVYYISFISFKTYLKSFVYIYNICIIYLDSSAMKSILISTLHITLNCWVISKTINTGENNPWVSGIYYINIYILLGLSGVWHIAFHFSQYLQLDHILNFCTRMFQLLQFLGAIDSNSNWLVLHTPSCFDQPHILDDTIKGKSWKWIVKLP